jgi:hypothetical protein
MGSKLFLTLDGGDLATSKNFLVTYYSFAHEAMQAADRAVTVEFEQKYRSLGGSYAEAVTDLQLYQAAAFEYLLIGAAVTAS